MDSIRFVNAGYNVAEPQGLTFSWALNQNAFLYFQGPVLINGKEYGSGTCILYKAGDTHNYTTLNGFVNSFIGFYCPEDIFSKLNIPCNKVFFPKNTGEINAILFAICRENSLCSFGYEIMLKARILELLVTIGKGLDPSDNERTSDLKNKMAVIRTEYLSSITSPPDFNFLLKEHGISRTNGYRLYSRLFHSSPKEDLIWARLEKSRELMHLNPESKIYEICELCGFTNIPHFFRIFKSRYGYTPGEYLSAIKSSSKP